MASARLSPGTACNDSVAESLHKTYGLLTVVAYEGRNNDRRHIIRCKCSCGRETVAELRYVRSGHTTSCGCVKLSRLSQKTHGLAKSAEHRAWTRMNWRCNKLCAQRKDYADRGITVCARWTGEAGFLNFLQDMGPKPAGTSLDRKDNDKGYAPDNCRWATAQQQASNRRSANKLAYKGRTQSATEWAAELKLSVAVVFARLHKLNWTVEKTLETPVRKHKKL